MIGDDHYDDLGEVKSVKNSSNEQIVGEVKDEIFSEQDWW